MKKVAVFLLFMALLSGPVYADGFAQREADRSGVSGTLNAVGNSIKGFFDSIGESLQRAKSGVAVHSATK